MSPPRRVAVRCAFAAISVVSLLGAACSGGGSSDRALGTAATRQSSSPGPAPTTNGGTAPTVNDAWLTDGEDPSVAITPGTRLLDSAAALRCGYHRAPALPELRPSRMGRSRLGVERPEMLIPGSVEIQLGYDVDVGVGVAGPWVLVENALVRFDSDHRIESVLVPDDGCHPLQVSWYEGELVVLFCTVPWQWELDEPGARCAVTTVTGAGDDVGRATAAFAVEPRDDPRATAVDQEALLVAYDDRLERIDRATGETQVFPIVTAALASGTPYVVGHDPDERIESTSFYDSRTGHRVAIESDADPSTMGPTPITSIALADRTGGVWSSTPVQLDRRRADDLGLLTWLDLRSEGPAAALGLPSLGVIFGPILVDHPSGVVTAWYTFCAGRGSQITHTSCANDGVVVAQLDAGSGAVLHQWRTQGHFTSRNTTPNSLVLIGADPAGVWYVAEGRLYRFDVPA